MTDDDGTRGRSEQGGPSWGGRRGEAPRRGSGPQRGVGAEGRSTGSRGRAGEGLAERGRSGAERGRAGRQERSRGHAEDGARQEGRRGHAGRAGEGRERTYGPRLVPTTTRLPEPAIPEDVTIKDVPRGVMAQLRTLSKDNAEGVALHLASSAYFLETDPEAALAHAETAVRRAGRVAAAREALGLVLYHQGDWAGALREMRTARRLSGSDHLLPYLVDAERGLGRPERALELAQSPQAQRLGTAEKVEMAIVISGIRRDMGQPRAAAAGLAEPAARARPSHPWAARLWFAYADALRDAGDVVGARPWFEKAMAHDPDGETEAAEVLAEMDGLVFTDLDEGEQDELADGGEQAAVSVSAGEAEQAHEHGAVEGIDEGEEGASR